MCVYVFKNKSLNNKQIAQQVNKWSAQPWVDQNETNNYVELNSRICIENHDQIQTILGMWNDLDEKVHNILQSEI